MDRTRNENETTAKVLEAMLNGAEGLDAVPWPPGIVGMTAKWIFYHMVKPYQPAAIMGSLLFWSFLASRRVRFQNQGTSIAALEVADSNAGKDALKKLAPGMLRDVGVPDDHFTGRICSHSAGMEMLQAIYPHPVCYSSDDECAVWFSGTDPYGAREFHRDVWSDPTDRIEAKQRTEKQGQRRLRSIPTPGYCCVKTLQPGPLAKVLQSEQLKDGTLSRFFWIVPDADLRIRKSEENLNRSQWLGSMDPDAADPDGNNFGPRILEVGKMLWDWLPPKDAERFGSMAEAETQPQPQPAKPGRSPGAGDDDEALAPKGRSMVWRCPQEFSADETIVATFNQIGEWEYRTEGRAKEEDEYLELHGKFGEKVKRISLALAAARCAENFTRDKAGRVVARGPFMLDLDETLWAVRWTLATDHCGIKWLRNNLADSRLAKMCNAVKDIVRKAPHHEIRHRELMRKCKNLWDGKGDAEWVLAYLCEAVEELEKVTDGKATLYRVKRD